LNVKRAEREANHIPLPIIWLQITNSPVRLHEMLLHLSVMESSFTISILINLGIITLILKHLFMNTLSQFRSNWKVTQLRELEVHDIANLSESSTGNPPDSIFRFVNLRA